MLDFIRFSKDKQKLKELVENDSAYQRLEESAYDVAVAFAGTTTLRKIKSEKEGNVDMCKELEVSKEVTFAKVKTKFGLQEEEAQNYMQMYWLEA